MTPGLDPSRVPEDRTLGDLLGQLSRDGALLVQQELALAKAELAGKADKLKGDLAAIASGALVLYAGLLTLIAAAVLLLAQFVATWLAALLVGAAVCIVGGMLLTRAKKRLESFEPLPKQTIRSVQRDAEVMKEAV